MLEVEEAQARIVAAIQPLPSEEVLLADSAGRIAAQPVTAAIALPPFDNSAMDGYALRAADVAGAGPGAPVRLQRIGSAPAGAPFHGTVRPGACVRVFTGSALPQGSDAVVMQEDTKTSGDEVDVLDIVRPWENVRLAGEDVKAGAAVVRAGEKITAARMALLGAVGTERIFVARKPLIALVGTGNELISPGQKLAPGQIYESNRVALASLVAQAGGLVRSYPLVRDTEAETRRALEVALRDCDAVLTTGGVSVGDHDCVQAAFVSLGGTPEFWKVALRPGKPFLFGRLGRKFLFGLPGNPVSAFVTFLVLARPAILRMQGALEVGLTAHPAVLAEAVQNRGDRRHYFRVRVEGDGTVRSTGAQASHALSSLASANALLDMPPNTSRAEGERVQVLRWEG